MWGSTAAGSVCSASPRASSSVLARPGEVISREEIQLGLWGRHPCRFRAQPESLRGEAVGRLKATNAVSPLPVETSPRAATGSSLPW